MLSLIPRHIRILSFLLGSPVSGFLVVFVREAAVVCLILGPQAYFADGVRILPRRPLRQFTQGHGDVSDIVDLLVLFSLALAPYHVADLLCDALSKRLRSPD